MCLFELSIPCLSNANNMLLQYIVVPFLIFIIIILLFIYFTSYSSERVIKARGGIRKMYSELFDAIEKMPESKIIAETPISFTATYLNLSKQYCKIKVDVTKWCTFVSFSIRHNNRWIKTAKDKYEGNYSGGAILWNIFLSFPDCDLSNDK